jgi:hypothetical protein
MNGDLASCILPEKGSCEGGYEGAVENSDSDIPDLFRVVSAIFLSSIDGIFY